MSHDRSRRDFIRRIAGAGLAASLSSCNRKQSAKRPNILFVMTDDQAISLMSCYGNRILKTPNMDRLASEGARFTNCFVTNSLCAPSRATVLSGAYSHVHKIFGNSEMKDAIETMDPAVPTFPELLQQAGYRTGIVGKWHLSHDPRGFETWRILPGQGVYFDPEFIENGTRKKYSGHATAITTNMAREFLDANDERPFCLVYQHKAPHRPFKPEPEHKDNFADIELSYPPTFDDDYATRKIAKEADDMRFDISLEGDYPDLPKNLSASERKRWIYQRYVKDMYRSVQGIDHNLGRVLEHLDESGQAENTLIIYTTDNGFFLGEHGWYDKRFMYEPSLRLPLLIRYPRLQRKGQVIDQMVLNIDFAPTILDFAGVKAPDTMQGVSLRPLLEGSNPESWRQSVYYHYYDRSWELFNATKDQVTDPTFQYLTPHRVGPHRGVRNARYKLIDYYTDNYKELFDLQNDPNELKNIYSDPASASIVKQLEQELERLKSKYEA